MIDFYPDVIHANDWHTALAPVFLDCFYRGIPEYRNIKSVASAPSAFKVAGSAPATSPSPPVLINGADSPTKNKIFFFQALAPAGFVVEEGAVIKNSIVMEHGVVQKDAELSYTITDKNVVITEGRRIAGYDTYPVVIAKDKTV